MQSVAIIRERVWIKALDNYVWKFGIYAATLDAQFPGEITIWDSRFGPLFNSLELARESCIANGYQIVISPNVED